jgi:hypothetical protein
MSDKEMKEWTLMFYFASDNPLAPGIVSQLKAIKDAGFHKEANVVARFDPRTVQTPTHIFDVNLVNKLTSDKFSASGFVANDPFVRNLVTDKLWGNDANEKPIRDLLVENYKRFNYNPPIPQDFAIDIDPDTNEIVAKPAPARVVLSGNARAQEDRLSDEPSPRDSLYSFLRLCSEQYPARHYILFILGHGVIVGNDIFLADEHAAGQRSLKLKELGAILKDFRNQIQRQDGDLELISFHSCSMSGLEVAYELKDAAKFMLASQGPAFVGSWPYRQILIRIFNDLSPKDFEAADLTDEKGLAIAILEGRTELADHLKGKLDRGLLKSVARGSRSEEGEADGLDKFVDALNEIVTGPDLRREQAFKAFAQSNGLHQFFAEEKDSRIINRRLIVEAFPKNVARVNIEVMLTKIFFFCLYNSFDFQLAGYSFDLCLCDLTKFAGDDENSFNVRFDELVRALISVLPAAEPPEVIADSTPPASILQELILLAHWKAQSYFDENYTDLYDFCFCLEAYCSRHLTLDPKKDVDALVRIKRAADGMMEVLQRGRQDGLIRHSESAGPAYQYSHGLSLFFPWSAPIADRMWTEEYPKYAINDRENSWRDFLKAYFGATMRKTHQAENDSLDQPSGRQNSDAEILEKMAGMVFNEFGQLKDDPKDKTGPKDDPRDPTGDDCTCATIKNYPPFTRSEPATSPRFFQGLRLG